MRSERSVRTCGKCMVVAAILVLCFGSLVGRWNPTSALVRDLLGNNPAERGSKTVGGEGEINEKISNKNPALAESDQTNDALRRVLGWKTALDTLKGEIQHELRLEIQQELLEQYQASKSEQPPFKFKSHPSKGGDKKAGASPLARSEGSWKSQCGVEEDANRRGHDLYDWAVKAATPSECCDACSTDDGCKAWVWQQPNHACTLVAGCAGCWLKDAANPTIPNPGCKDSQRGCKQGSTITGLPQRANFERHSNQDCQGNDIRMHRACREHNLEDCTRELEDACRADPRCTAFNVPGGWLKSACNPT